MESFGSTLKLEMVYRQDFDSHEQARRRASPELPVGRRTCPQQKVRQRSGMGPKPALEAINPSLAHSAKAEPPPSFPAAQDPSRGAYASKGLISSPAMSVRRKSRPSKRWVKRVCSMPSRCSIVACKSCTFTGFSTML